MPERRPVVAGRNPAASKKVVAMVVEFLGGSVFQCESVGVIKTEHLRTTVDREGGVHGDLL